jgi:cell division protease FtsH
MDEGYQKAEQILKDNRDKLHEVAARLIEQETMEAHEFDVIMNGQAAEG